eukprot:TRINITY_DN443_c0_g1_i1.p3 TRINITY_DN443_c0_g1~~TRINITY_DN443_c0_g1_i1.p3  ORF type:complete len:72 (-),score=6.37 TRINITY_DN443_c0_g1_i1:335-550(-)
MGTEYSEAGLWAVDVAPRPQNRMEVHRRSTNTGKDTSLTVCARGGDDFSLPPSSSSVVAVVFVWWKGLGVS